MFSQEYQDLAVTVVQKNERSLYEDEIDLYEATIVEFDWIEIELPSVKKRVLIYIEDDTSLISYKNLDYTNNESSKEDDNESIDIVSNQSIQDPKKFLALA